MHRLRAERTIGLAWAASTLRVAAQVLIASVCVCVCVCVKSEVIEMGHTQDNVSERQLRGDGVDYQFPGDQVG